MKDDGRIWKSILEGQDETCFFVVFRFPGLFKAAHLLLEKVGSSPLMKVLKESVIWI